MPACSRHSLRKWQSFSYERCIIVITRDNRFRSTFIFNLRQSGEDVSSPSSKPCIIQDAWKRNVSFGAIGT